MKPPTNTAIRVFRYTPWRDIVRGRMTRRLDWRRPIAQAELPELIPALIERVVKRTRLTKLEKSDIARELCAHFQDGIKEGTPPSTLVKDFGDERTAAKLMTRAKKRTRPPFRKACMRTLKIFGVFLLLLLAVYAFEFVRFNTAKPNIARNYTAEYNAEIDKIPMDQRAWPIYRQAIIKASPMTQEEAQMSGVPITDSNYESHFAYIQRNADFLVQIRQAASIPHMGFPWSNTQDPELFKAMYPGQELEPLSALENPSVVSILLPHLGSLRRAAQLLAIDASLAAFEGDANRAYEDLMALIGMASHESPTETIIEQLIEIAIFHQASQTLHELLWHNPDLFTTDQLADFARTFESFGYPDEYIINLDGEHAMFHDAVQRIYSDDGHGDGHLTAKGLREFGILGSAAGVAPEEVVGPQVVSVTGPITMHFVADRRDLVAKYNEIIALVIREHARPLCERLRDTQDPEWLRMHAQLGTKYPLIQMLMPAYDRVFERGIKSTMTRNATVTLIALERFRIGTRAYPTSLDELVPKYLPAVPEDIFDCNPLRYRLHEGRPLIYSTGFDQQDDGGHPYISPEGADSSTAMNRGKTGIDWIFFPPSSYWWNKQYNEEEYYKQD